MSDVNPVSVSGSNVPVDISMEEISLDAEAEHVRLAAPKHMPSVTEKVQKLTEHQVSNLTEALGSAVKDIKRHPDNVKNIVVGMMLMMAVALIVAGVAGSIFPFAGGFFIVTGAMIAIATLVVSHPEAFAAEGKGPLHEPPFYYRDPDHESTALLSEMSEEELRRQGFL